MHFRSTSASLLAAAAGLVTALPTTEEQDLQARAAITLPYSERALIYHNLHRMNHSSVNVTWDNDLAASAETLAKKCEFKHDT
jgi:hypothetical protein